MLNDRSKLFTNKLAFVLLIFCGTIFALSLQIGYAYKYGENVTRLLSVSNDSGDLEKFIIKDLGNVSIESQTGHDGLFFYYIARNPSANSYPLPSLEGLKYRYRRIFYPAIAGLGGSLSGAITLYNMIAISAISFGIIFATYVYLSRHNSSFLISGLIVILNPGLWCSFILLTSENLGICLALLAIIAYLKKYKKSALLLFSLSVLTKEIFLLFAISIIFYDWMQNRKFKRAIAEIILISLPLLAWICWIEFFSVLPNDNFGINNFAMPFQGIIKTLPIWYRTANQDYIFSYISLINIMIAILIISISHNRFFSILLLPWVVLAIFSSDWIWTLGNNSIRVFAPVLLINGSYLCSIINNYKDSQV